MFQMILILTIIAIAEAIRLIAQTVRWRPVETAVRLTPQVLSNDVLQGVVQALAMVTKRQYTNLDRLPIPDLPGRVDPEVSLL